jgi:hypothetical protein
MADNSTGLNAQYDSAGAQIVPGSYASTGAPGSPGEPDEAHQGSLIGSPVVSAPYGTSQLPANMPSVDVYQGDTSGFSDDNPVHESPTMPGPASAYLSTGAGQGHADAWPRHPWQSQAGRD